MDHRETNTLRTRATVLGCNIVFFWFFYWLTSGSVLPAGGLESVWFLCAIALWFFSLLSSPWFVPPRDALANAVGSTAILVTIDLTALYNIGPQLDLLRWLAVAYNGIVSIVAISALVLHERSPGSPSALATFRTSSILGRGEILYTPAALISIVGAHQDSPVTMAWLLILWMLFVVAKPIEKFSALIGAWRADKSLKAESPDIGTIERIDHPNIIRVKLSKSSAWKPGTLHVAAMSDGDMRFVLALFSQVQGTEVMGTGLSVAVVGEQMQIPVGRVRASHDPEKTAAFLEKLSGTTAAELVGFTVENSSIGILRFEIASSSDLSEGDVVFARINSQDVFYQILDAETSEESFDHNPHGTYIVRAAQLGCYSSESGFTKYPWLPAMNSPLFWAKKRLFPQPKLTADEFIVGEVPSTNIGVVAKLEELVEYHTAVLGVTGTGKTELALDIVREAVARKTKVFCVDFTGEYRARLADIDPVFPAPTAEGVANLEAKIFEAETGEFRAGKEKRALDAVIKSMRGHIEKQMSEFLVSDHNWLAIFELSEIANTRATLRLTELYLSEIMSWARKNRKARQTLIVLEEAHTIIPETHGSGFDFDTQWVVSRIGQIALQGRKYGVGLLVVSQRTALVSKTILSQCNTFFTHSLIDQTSLGFLESVYSAQHVRLIPNLRFLECLAFGKALRTERPILIRRKFEKEKKDASERMKRPLPEPGRPSLELDVDPD